MNIPEGAGPGPWTTCGDCGEPVPCSVDGYPYPHTCRTETK